MAYQKSVTRLKMEPLHFVAPLQFISEKHLWKCHIVSLSKGETFLVQWEKIFQGRESSYGSSWLEVGLVKILNGLSLEGSIKHDRLGTKGFGSYPLGISLNPPPTSSIAQLIHGDYSSTLLFKHINTLPLRKEGLAKHRTYDSMRFRRVNTWNLGGGIAIALR